MAKVRSTAEGSYLFDCPGCNQTHVVYQSTPGRPRWTFNGDLEKPTFSPSILVRWERHPKDGPTEHHVCHSFVKDGMIQFLGDCTHDKANQTLEIPEWE